MPVQSEQLLFGAETVFSSVPWQKAVAAEKWAQDNVMAREAMPSLAGSLARLSSLFLSLAALCKFISMHMTSTPSRKLRDPVLSLNNSPGRKAMGPPGEQAVSKTCLWQSQQGRLFGRQLVPAVSGCESRSASLQPVL